jgi:5-methylcytosine-specific restriction endonuclease McrA
VSSLPKKTIDFLFKRSGGLCENCGAPAADAAHISPKQMGGRKGIWKKIWDDVRNLFIACRSCHDLVDLKRRELYPGERLSALTKVKIAVNHQSWKEEYGIV